MVGHVISTIDPMIPYKKVWASRGKATRAEPISTLYGSDDGKRECIIRHVPGLDKLEDQQMTWVPGEGDSPDRVDALVWGMTELFFEEEETDEIVEDYEPMRIGADI
jgi:phage terminase large subunit-like protein